MEAGTLSWVDFEAAARYWAESSSRVGATLAGQRLSWVWDWEWRAAGAQGVLPGQGFLALRPVARRVLLQGRCTPEAEDKYEQRPAEEQQEEDTSRLEVEEAMAAVEGEWVEFTFHVLWSATFSVPVMYFTANFADGSPLPAAAVCSAVALHSDNGGEPLGQPWTFLTQEEHPVLGTPAFMFHPCQTAERLASMAAPPPAGRPGAAAGLRLRHVLRYLLAWLAMLAPTLRLELPPATYLALLEALLPSCPAAGVDAVAGGDG